MGIQRGHWASVACLAPKPCDSCKASPAAVFCQADLAYLCLMCDAKIHSANKLTSHHSRVWMCEVCEHAPAAVTCKADAAALCVTCDSDIHSANPLASRHERVPVTPFFDSATESIAKSTTNVSYALNFFVPDDDVLPKEPEDMSLLIPNPNFINNPKFMDMIAPDMKSGDVFFSEMDSLLDFDYPNPIHHNISGSDSVVPVKTKTLPVPVQPPNSLINCNQASTETCFDIDFCRSKLSSSFSYPTHSLNQSVSSSSLDVGVVPDGSSLSEISYPFTRNASHNVSDPGVPVSAATSAASQATQLCGLDREARVLRYREKRKNRKFQKTIRYASRKAYAETRPRIKGRFVKRAETETEGVDRIYGSDITICSVDSQYGVVPTF